MMFGRAEADSLDRPITTAGQLLVEGRSSEIFFREMVEKHNLAMQIEVRTFGSSDKDTLQTYLEIFTQKAAVKEKVRAMGIIRDAEDRLAESGFRAVCSALKSANQSVPDALRIFSAGPLRVGVFILPDCHQSGMLESLCLEVVQQKESAVSKSSLGCVNEFVQCLKQSGAPARNETKVRLGAYLLSRGVHDTQVGRAAQKGIFAWDSNVLDALRAFLADLAQAAVSQGS